MEAHQIPTGQVETQPEDSGVAAATQTPGSVAQTGRGCVLEAGEQELLGQEPVLGALVLVLGARVVELAAKTPGDLVRVEVEPVWVPGSVGSLQVGADTKTGTPAS